MIPCRLKHRSPASSNRWSSLAPNLNHSSSLSSGALSKVFLLLSLTVAATLCGDWDRNTQNQKTFSLPIKSSSSLTGSNSFTGYSNSSANHTHSSGPLKVAIIGGGPGGTSASFFLSKLANISGNELEVHIFERSDRLGGRTKVIYPFDEPERYDPIEAGASMFVEANRHLNKAVREFNLTTVLFNNQAERRLGIWDGTEFAFQESGNKWLDKVKVLWRYGRAPLQLDAITKRTVAKFESVYGSEFVSKGPFEHLDEWAVETGLSDLFKVTASENFVDQESINVQAVNELAASAARVNYGQDISSIHGVGGLVSLAGVGATSVKGGNRQIFENFASRSGAKVHLSHHVTSIARVRDTGGREKKNSSSSSKFIVSSRELSKDSLAVDLDSIPSIDSEPFDAVVIAAPFHQTRFDQLDVGKLRPIPNQAFVHLHVTLLVTNLTAPSGKHFGGGENDQAPTTIYSTMMRNVLGKGKRPIFNSLSYLRNLGKREGVIGELSTVKIFSEGRISNETLKLLFKSSENILWIKRLEWDSYPFLSPMTSKESFGPTKLSESFYYLNAFESLISTMETQTISAWNAVNLITRDHWHFTANQSWVDMV